MSERRLKNETITVDLQTGEAAIVSKNYSVRADDSDSFYMSFIEMMSPFFKIKSLIDIQVLAKMCCMMEYNKNEVYLPTARRRQLCEELKIKTTHLSNALKRLRNIGMIAGDSGCYRINPKVYWKGTTNERNQLLKDKGLELNIIFKATDNKEL